MAVLKNRAKMSTSTTGTGTITLGSAESGYQTFADAGVANADVVRYVIEDGSNFEIGTGTYTSSGTTLSRTVSESSNSNNAINLSGSATVFIGATAEDIELSGNMAGDISSNGHAIKLGDRTGSGANELIMGAGDDFKLYHNGATGHSIISETGSGNLQIAATNIELKAASGHALLTATYGGSVDLYHNSSKKAETTSSGLQTTGTLNVNGAYTLPTSDGSANQVLTTNGSGAVTFADAGGGGGSPDLFAESYDGSSTKPSASGSQNAVSIGVSANASGHDTISIGESSSAVSSKALALGYSAYAGGGGQNTAIGPNSFTGTSAYSSAFGHNAYSTGQDGVAIGQARSTGTDSLAAAIANNSSSYGATGSNSIAMGYLSKATQEGAVAIGYDAVSTGIGSVALGRNCNATDHYATAIGSGNTASQNQATAVFGENNTASANNALAIGGGSNTASGTYSIAAGSSATASGNNSISLGRNTVASGADSIAMGYGADASNTHNVAIGYNSEASTGTYNFAFGSGATANASYYAVAIGSDAGGNGSTAGGNGSFATSGGVTAGNQAQALGKAYASGSNSFAAAIANTTSSYGATGANSVAMGQQAKATASQAFTVNGYAQGTRSIAIGASSHATSTYGCAIGYDTTAVGSALALGTQANAQAGYSVAIHRGKAEQRGKIAFSGGIFATQGDAQGGQFVLLADTTDATATVLTSNNGSASTDNQIVAASDTCITFDGTITAMQNGAQAYASWKIEGLLVNDGGTTTLANSATTVIQNLSSWGMALSADNTNNALAITCTGEASHNIRWVANIRTTEVTYA